MPENTRVRTLLTVLEDLLVQEFRLIQNLITITREERNYLPSGDTGDLMNLVERKESVLDQLALLEEKRRTVVHECSRELGVQTQSSSLGEILPWVEPATAARMNRLSEGIAMLVGQARDLNYGNRAMATTALDWIESAKAFLFGFYQNQSAYAPPGAAPALEQTPAWGRQHSA